MKKRTNLIAVVVLLLLFALPILTACDDDKLSYDFISGDFGYKIVSDTTVSLTFLHNKNLENAIIPSKVEHEQKTYSITSIGEGVFAPVATGMSLNEIFHYSPELDDKNDKLKTVAFAPDCQVEKIGNRAFEKCKAMQSIALPESLKEIGGFAFYKCENLTEISLPKNVQEIKDFAFTGSSKLAKVVLEVTDKDKIPKLGAQTFKIYDSSQAGFMSSTNPYQIIENLKIFVGSQEIASQLQSFQTSTIVEYRNWFDYTAKNLAVIGG